MLEQRSFSQGRDNTETNTIVSAQEILSMCTSGFEQYGFQGELEAFKYNEPKSGRPIQSYDSEYFPADVTVNGKPVESAESVYAKVRYSNKDGLEFELALQKYNPAYDRKGTFVDPTVKEVEISRYPEFKGDFRSFLDRQQAEQWESTITINYNGVLKTYAKLSDGTIKLVRTKALDNAVRNHHTNEVDAVPTREQFDAIRKEVLKVAYPDKS